MLTSIAATAHAADLTRGSMKDIEPVPYVPPITWAGFYFGAHGGAAFLNDDSRIFDGFDFFDAGDDGDPKWGGGVHAGYNFERPSIGFLGIPGGWVFGIEADVAFADNIDYLATVRARVGYAVDNTLFYATAGGAFVGLDNNRDFDEFGNIDDSQSGWVAGLGVEGKFSPSLSLGLEALYYDFGDGDEFDIDEDLRFLGDDVNFWTVRARLTYYLGPRDYDLPSK